MEFHFTGKLNVVITDPTKPVCYEQKIEGTLPCTVLVIGPQYSDPPAPTEVASDCSEAAHPELVLGKPAGPADEGINMCRPLSLSAEELSKYDSGWRAEQASFDKEHGLPPARLPRRYLHAQRYSPSVATSVSP